MVPPQDEHSRVADEEGAFVRFLDIAGHDLRNPIAVLKTHLQLLQRRLNREGGRAEDLRDLGRMSFQIERLIVGLDTYLEAAHIAQGQFELRENTCDLGDIVRRLAAMYGLASRAHTITFMLPNEPVIARWDGARVELALAILLTNALKYSPRGRILVRVTREPSYARVSVTDSGIGVPSGEESAIFEAYTSGSNVENPGAGLGLYVARAIANGHGGDIGATSPPGSNGSTFWFTLPLPGAPGATSTP